MDISKMSDERKSVLLARARGWDVWRDKRTCFGKVLSDDMVIGWDDEDGYRHTTIDIYSEPVDVAWLLLNWAGENEAMGEYHAWWGDTVREPMWFILNQYLGSMVLGKLPAAVLKRLLLDKILTLAIEAGIVEKE